MRLKIYALLLVCFSEAAYSQRFTLRQCIDRVQVRNQSVQIAESARESKRWEYRQAKDAFFPSIHVTNQHSLSFGRVLDPTTYQFVTSRPVYDMNAAIGGSITLFSGLERVYQVKKAGLGLRGAELEVDRVRSNLALEVTRLFLEVLMDEEAVEVYENKVELMEKQQAQIRRKVELKAATPGDLLSLQADMARAQVEHASALSELYSDKIALCELLVVEDWEHLELSGEGIADVAPQIWDKEDLYDGARRLPQVLQQELMLEQARREMQIVSASYLPTFRLNAGYGSTFSNARVSVTGEESVFRDQFRDNMSAYVTATVSIPILSAITVSHSIRARRAAFRSSEQEFQRTLLSLDKEVKQALVQAATAYQMYELLVTEENKAEEALRQMEMKYDVGAVTYYDYQIAVGNLYQARAERLRARYEYVYRTKVMDYYAQRDLGDQ